jgi:hypothetical protein
VDKLILEVYIRQTLEGPAMMFRWPTGAREAIERAGVLDVIGEALAAFGEQLRMQGLGLTSQGPAILYGPNGRPIA